MFGTRLSDAAPIVNSDDGGDHPLPAPRGLRPEEVALLVRELAPALTGARIEKVFRRGDDAYVLRLRAQGERRELFLSTRVGFSRFHLVAPSAADNEVLSPDVAELRALINQGAIESLEQLGHDRVVRIALRVVRDNAVLARTLVLELFGARGRLVLFDTTTRVILWLAGRSGNAAVGEVYRFPEAPPRRKPETPPFEPRVLLAAESELDDFAFNHALAARMASAEQAADDRARCDQLAHVIQEEQKRRLRLAEHLELDLATARTWPLEQRHGDLLKAETHRLRRGMTECQVVDYFDASLPTITIALDVEKTPLENVEALFARARKGKRAEAQVTARLAQCRSELEKLELAASCLRAGIDDSASAAAAERALKSVELKRRVKQAPPTRARASGATAASTATQWLRYRTRQGLDVLRGRSARANDQLTMTVANGNDLFFHRAHRPGPHVILRVPRGVQVAPESIEDAAFIAAYFSGWRGPGAVTVHWTEAKYVRKPRGAPAGLVTLAREREYRVEYRPELLERLVLADENPLSR
ncbi:MAG: NFACT RNA binding domain-containing protein [Planctomycetota bacterium]